jgi:hypothetical protein
MHSCFMIKRSLLISPIHLDNLPAQHNQSIQWTSPYMNLICVHATEVRVSLIIIIRLIVSLSPFLLFDAEEESKLYFSHEFFNMQKL